jgi:hypothetical protein
MRVLAVVVCLFLVGCGGDEAPSEGTVGSGLASEKAQVRASLDGLMPEIETFLLHSIGMNADGGAAGGDKDHLGRDKDRLVQALAEVRAETESIADATLRGHVIRMTVAFNRWLELDPDQPPSGHEKGLWRRWANEMRAIDTATRRYDAAMDAAGAPKNRRDRLSTPPPP